MREPVARSASIGREELRGPIITIVIATITVIVITVIVVTIAAIDPDEQSSNWPVG